MEGYDLALSGVQFRMYARLVSRIRKAGATSIAKALTVDELGLDLQEQCWLSYFAGAFLETIKKTKDQRYYV